ncbi:hypothetical protein MASR2M48_14510 [Spirochaetota bacterium]
MKKKLFSIENKKKEYDLAMQKMNTMYVVICIGGKTTIYHKDRNNNNMMSVRDARDFCKHDISCQICRKGNDVIERRQVFDDWFVSPETERYESLTFDPTMPYGALGTEWNTWRGWKYEPADGDCSLYLEHIIENICNGDRIFLEYIFDLWLKLSNTQRKKSFMLCLSKAIKVLEKQFSPKLS